MSTTKLRPTTQVIVSRLSYQSVSQSQDDTIYELEWSSTQWTCTCPGFVYRKWCKHLTALAERAESEGWKL